MGEEIPWAWYVSRSSACLGFSMLWLSIFLGLAVRTPVLNKFIKPAYSLGAHRWISLQALFFSFIHGTSLLFDNYINFGWKNVFIPFYPLRENSIIDGNLLSLGIMGFYAMVIMIVTSYIRRHIPYHVWRSLHFLNVGLYIAVVIHALYMGTDLKSGIVRNVFIYANVFLAIIFAYNLLIKLILAFKANEVIREGYNKVIEKRNNQNFRR